MHEIILIVRTVFDHGDGYALYRIQSCDYERAFVAATGTARERYDNNEDEWKSFYDCVEEVFQEKEIHYSIMEYEVASIDMRE